MRTTRIDLLSRLCCFPVTTDNFLFARVYDSYSKLNPIRGNLLAFGSCCRTSTLLRKHNENSHYLSKIVSVFVKNRIRICRNPQYVTKIRNLMSIAPFYVGFPSSRTYSSSKSVRSGPPLVWEGESVAVRVIHTVPPRVLLVHEWPASHIQCLLSVTFYSRIYRTTI